MKHAKKQDQYKTPCICQKDRFQEYFKIGVSDDFILLRNDFPIPQLSPGEFSRLIAEMFRQNDEVRHGK